MDELENYVSNRDQKEPGFKLGVKEDEFSLRAAVAVRELRDQLHLSQRDFGDLVGKPHSTIARIESGDMFPTTKLLSEIASKTNKNLVISFE